MNVYKVVQKTEDGQLFSVWASGSWLREYRVGQETFSDPPLFAFADQQSALRFANSTDEVDVVVFLAETDEVLPAPKTLPYVFNDEMPDREDKEWRWFWKEHDMWEENSEYINYWPPTGAVLCHSITLLQEVQ